MYRSFDLDEMDEINKAYKNFVAKLKLVDKDGGIEKELFKVKGFAEISVNIFKLAKINGYPSILNIPHFVTKIITEQHSIEENQKIKHIYFHDKMEIDYDTLKYLNDVKGLRSISISSRQFILYQKAKYKIETKMISEGKIGLFPDELETINRRNKVDQEMENDPYEKELFELLIDLDMDLVFRLSIHLRETIGFELIPTKNEINASYQMLKHLFDFDINKLKKYLNEEKANKKR